MTRHIFTTVVAISLVPYCLAEDAPNIPSGELIFKLDQMVAADRGLKISQDLIKTVQEQVEARLDQLKQNQQIDLDLAVRTIQGKDRIKVEFPKNVTFQQFEQVKATLLDSGWIEFAILANKVQHADLIALSEKESNRGKHRIYRDDRLVGLWCPVAVDKQGRPKIQASHHVATREVKTAKQPDIEYLVVVDPDPETRLTNHFFETIAKQKTEYGLQISFQLDREGAALMEEITARNLPTRLQPENPPAKNDAREDVDDGQERSRSRLAIIIDGKIHMAPTINGIISSTGVIQGSFEDEELDSLIRSLRLVPLQVPLELVE